MGAPPAQLMWRHDKLVLGGFFFFFFSSFPSVPAENSPDRDPLDELFLRPGAVGVVVE